MVLLSHLLFGPLGRNDSSEVDRRRPDFGRTCERSRTWQAYHKQDEADGVVMTVFCFFPPLQAVCVYQEVLVFSCVRGCRTDIKECYIGV